MSDPNELEIPPAAQPKTGDVPYDLDMVLSSVVSLRSKIPTDAFTAPILGTERGGNGIIIGDNGLILTIGYLITEAESVWVFTGDGKAAAAHVVGYDFETGLGLVQAMERLAAPSMPIGSSGDLEEGDPVIVAGHGGRSQATKANVVAKREFAGYWEYVLDEAILTAPPHPNWGGTALLGGDGTLRGVGSLFVQQARVGEQPLDGNMMVPIDLLEPIIGDLLSFGRTTKPPRPWLGIYATEAGDGLIIAGLADGGPAHEADAQPGDIVVQVGGERVTDLADMFRRVWAQGEAGVEVPLTVLRDGEQLQLRVRSADRVAFLKSPRLH